jgi:hypothetical protein
MILNPIKPARIVYVEFGALLLHVGQGRLSEENFVEVERELGVERRLQFAKPLVKNRFDLKNVVGMTMT